MFSSAAEAIHECYDAREGVQDPFGYSVPGTSVSDSSLVRQAELAKVRKVVEALPKSVRDTVMLCYAPESANRKERDRVAQRLWKRIIEVRASNDLSVYKQTVKATILVACAIEECRSRANNGGAAVLSDAAIGVRIGTDASNYGRTWKEAFEICQAELWDHCLSALTDVGIVVDRINHESRKTG